MLQQQLTALEARSTAESRHGVFPFGGLLVTFLPDFLPCVPPPGLGRLAVEGVPRRAPGAGVLSRLPAASLISRSLISSHWASVRWRSGIARSCCRRSRGEIGCGVFMLALSHRSTRAAAPGHHATFDPRSPSHAHGLPPPRHCAGRPWSLRRRRALQSSWVSSYAACACRRVCGVRPLPAGASLGRSGCVATRADIVTCGLVRPCPRERDPLAAGPFAGARSLPGPTMWNALALPGLRPSLRHAGSRATLRETESAAHP
jgi:hypothetical protein